MTLNETQVAALQQITQRVEYINSSMGHDDSVATEADMEWMDHVETLMGIINDLTGGMHEVEVSVYLDRDLHGHAAHDLVSRLAADGVDLKGAAYNGKLFLLTGVVPVRVDIAALIRQRSQTVLAIEVGKEAKANSPRLTECIEGINVAYLGAPLDSAH